MLIGEDWQLMNPGWMTVYGREVQTDDTPTLAPVQQNETVQTSAIEVVPSQTKPPPRFTEATLLSAMEGAGKLVEDEELREAMSEKGLGTPATRAAIIEGLLSEQYLLRQGRELQATAKAFSLMELLNGLGIPELTKPELTGDWEFQLRQVQRRQKTRDEFMTGIVEITRRIVDRAVIGSEVEHFPLLVEPLLRKLVGIVENHGDVLAASYRKRLARGDVDQKIGRRCGSDRIRRASHPAVLLAAVGGRRVPVRHRREVRKARVLVPAAMHDREFSFLI